MNLPKISLRRGQHGGIVFPKISRNTAIFWSALFFAASAAILFGFDAYIFYQNVIDRSIPPPKTSERIKFSEGDIDEIARLLDEREKKFNEILSGNQ